MTNIYACIGCGKVIEEGREKEIRMYSKEHGTDIHVYYCTKCAMVLKKNGKGKRN